MTYLAELTCRACGHQKLEKIFDLGEQPFSGLFPKEETLQPMTSRLSLYRCIAQKSGCHLVQLGESLSPEYMYGDHYGYRSGLNASMVTHLAETVEFIKNKIDLRRDDYVLDIGSNDGTLLGMFPSDMNNLYGIDPSAKKFVNFYKENINRIETLFSKLELQKYVGEKRFKVVTSLSMFYDLESPIDFMKDVASLLTQDGIWVTEQSDLYQMIDSSSFDTICHEHLEYYSTSQINWMAKKAGLKIIDISYNTTNGGSSRLVLSREDSSWSQARSVGEIIAASEERNLTLPQKFNEFQVRIETIRNKTKEFLLNAKAENKKVYGLGASTKGNVFLNWCGLGPEWVSGIFDVNPDKEGAYCPGTNIPILADKNLESVGPDYLLVLPWHFKNSFLGNPRYRKFSLVFALPDFHVIPSQ